MEGKNSMLAMEILQSYRENDVSFIINIVTVDDLGGVLLLSKFKFWIKSSQIKPKFLTKFRSLA